MLCQELIVKDRRISANTGHVTGACWVCYLDYPRLAQAFSKWVPKCLNSESEEGTIVEVFKGILVHSEAAQDFLARLLTED